MNTLRFIEFTCTIFPCSYDMLVVIVTIFVIHFVSDDLHRDSLDNFIDEFSIGSITSKSLVSLQPVCRLQKVHTIDFN